jgi:hypothetical protein
MALNIRLATTNIVLKTISLLLGFTLWYIMSNTLHTSFWLTVPVCFDNTPESFALDAVDHIRICIGGTRADTRSLNTKEIAFHIDGQQLHTGDNTLLVTSEKLFLPPSIKLLNYEPLVLHVHATRTISKDTTACTA